MTRSVVTVSPELCIFEAIGVLLKHSISGAPVVESGDVVAGMLSEHDCLRVLASDEFYLDDHAGSRRVADFMSAGAHTISPSTDIYSIAQYFAQKRVRRFPVVEDGRLVGLVSRRDVLRGIEHMRAGRKVRKHYPDYREPAGAARTP